MKRIAGNQLSDRRSRDEYSTDPLWTQVLIDNVRLAGNVWEPACGDGAMASVLHSAGYTVKASDIAHGDDFLLSQDRADTIVTNPPYRLATEFIEHGLSQANRMLCLLLGWHLIAGGRERADRVWMKTPPFLVIAIADRMPYGREASQFNHAWAIWYIGDDKGETELMWAKAR